MKIINAVRDALLCASLTLAAGPLYFNATAVSSANGQSRFECWQFANELVYTTDTAINKISATNIMGDATNITYNVVPSGLNTQVFTSAVNEWLVILHGVVRISGADDKSLGFLSAGGEAAMAFLTAGTPGEQGYSIWFPGPTEATLLQIPTADGAVPQHKILYDNGPCAYPEYAGMRLLAEGDWSKQ
ncbi:hypothetical protein F4777DRAFT_566329 [Nemania sp. FL0916]|nr:hypothetical protein F4777DRAFT_566329 [Nemania sp. FL0916]